MKAVLFDLDDTLYDRYPAIRTYAQHYFYKDFGPQLSTIDQEWLAQALITADGGPLRGGREAMQALQRALPWLPGKMPSWQELLAHWQAYFPYCSHWTPELDQLLRSLSQLGWKIGIVTNGPGPGQRQKIDTLGIGNYLDAVVISGEYGVKKPDPAIFMEALRQLGVVAHQSWFVGDNPATDIAGAVSAGLKAIWLRRYHRPWYGPLSKPPVCKDSMVAVGEFLVGCNKD
ncbi:HAD family hydrolase [Sulfobacillus sp. hq2]|uniref:HAD family hydrolase n=1 Tax=Sulfobacillus TaxID=28033 RepID=UPI000CD0177E|nr:HAD family hydrolase [Sulfobacillus sp. hq2]POB10173.1 haloacid dehalogenase [Sulfobacillus sp. hq2]